MEREALVFEDATTNLAILVSRALAFPVALSSTDVRGTGAQVIEGAGALTPEPPAASQDTETTAQNTETTTAQDADDVTFRDTGFGRFQRDAVASQPELRKGLFEAGFLDMSLSQDFDLEGFLTKAKKSVGRKLDIRPCTSHDLIGVRRDEEGYALCDVDLLAYARSCEEPPVDTVLILPSSIDGIPVYRITTNAFKQRFVHGVELRALIIPASVKHLERGALSALSVRDVFYGGDSGDIGPQPFLSVRTMEEPPRRAFHIDENNAAYRDVAGSIFTKDLTTLVSNALPCPELIELPDSIRHIMSGALETASEIPRRVVCPEGLARVDSPLDHSLLWVCDPDGDLAKRFHGDSAVTLTRDHVCQDGFFYDIREDGRAYLVKSPYAVDRLTLPAYVGGRPLVRIEPGALPRRVISLTLPDTVEEIGEGNICGTLVQLSLGSGLRLIGQGCFRSRLLEGIVHIPASVTSIGRMCFENSICLFEKCGCIVHVPSDGLLDCFSVDDCGRGDGIPFDFERYDTVITSEHYIPDKVGAILERLMHPFALSNRFQQRFLEWMVDHEQETLERVARIGDAGLLDTLFELGFLGAETIDAQIELLRQMNRTDCVILLMDYRRKLFGEQPSARERFSL